MLRLALLSLCACQPSGSWILPEADPAPPPVHDPEPQGYTPDPTVQIESVQGRGHVAVVRSVEWPGGGRELTVRTPAGVEASDFSVDAGPYALDVVATPAVLPPGHTALLLAPGASVPQVAAAIDFVELRPAEERIAVYVATRPIAQVIGFTRDHAAVSDALDAVPLLTGQPMADWDEAVRATADMVDSVEGRGSRGLRSVVAFPWDDVETPSLDPAVFAIRGTGEVQSTSDWLDTLASEHHWTVAVCGPPQQLDAQVAVAGAGHARTRLRASLPDEADLPCDPTAIGPGKRDLPDTVHFRFTPDQRSTWEQRVSWLSTADFELYVDLGSGRTPVLSQAHLRGNSTLSCDRKSYTLKLGDRSRALFEDSWTDEFTLISMCQDDHYVEQVVANHLMAEAGSFPLKFRYVELVIDGDTEGVYLLIEKTREELVRDQARPRSVLRRGYDDYAVKWRFDGDNMAALEAADAIVEATYGRSGAALQRAVNVHLDLENYLSWLALMSALQNGDTIDETWFVSSASIGPDLQPSERFMNTGWDCDDLFSPCHAIWGVFDDRWDLVFCAEADLDFALLGDPKTYGRYVDTLERVLVDEVTPEHFNEVAEQVGTELASFFDRPGVPGAMPQLGTRDAEIATTRVRRHLERMASDYRRRHERMLRDIDRYRQR